jgi:hypothetical protein
MVVIPIYRVGIRIKSHNRVQEADTGNKRRLKTTNLLFSASAYPGSDFKTKGAML